MEEGRVKPLPMFRTCPFSAERAVDWMGFTNWGRDCRVSSIRTMALGSTQPLTEMSTRNHLGVKGGRRVRLTTLSPSVSRLSRKMWEPRRLTTLWAFTACYRNSFTLFFFTISPHLQPSTVYLQPLTWWLPHFSLTTRKWGLQRRPLLVIKCVWEVWNRIVTGLSIVPFRELRRIVRSCGNVTVLWVTTKKGEVIRVLRYTSKRYVTKKYWRMEV
jgi:hypothetical protein